MVCGEIFVYTKTSFLLCPISGKCQRLLERGSSPYAQLLATTTITKLISRSSAALELQSRVDIRNYVLNYLWSKPKLAQFACVRGNDDVTIPNIISIMLFHLR